jgi:Cu(I)/Ag(I) efflux system membrane protein CusA/SilA
MRRIAAPMVGGVVTSFIAELIVFPAIYFIWRALKLQRSPLFAVADRGGHGPSETPIDQGS